MASLNDIVSISISTIAAAVKEPGFGIPLIADYHTVFSERVRFYTDLDGMVSDGFATTSSAYLAASAAFAQEPQLDQIAIGRRALNPVMRYDITPINLIANHVYRVKVTAPNGTSGTASFTADASPTLAEFTAGMSSAITALALSGVTSADNASTTARVTATVATNWLSVESLDLANVSVKQTHVDPGIATDLAAIKLENDSWYGLFLSSSGAAEIAAAASWAESNKKLALFSSQDSDIYGSGSGDIASTLQTANEFRSAVLFHPNPIAMAGAAWFGATFPANPGSITFKFKRLAGVANVALTQTQITNMEAKNCNFFTDYGGISITVNGKVAAGEWIDIIRDRDWFEARLQARIANVLIGSPKVPYTDGGIAQIESEVRGQCREGIDAGFLSPDSAPVITVPKVANVSASDKSARVLRNVKFSAVVAGAIHATEVTGTISV